MGTDNTNVYLKLKFSGPKQSLPSLWWHSYAVQDQAMAYLDFLPLVAHAGSCTILLYGGLSTHVGLLHGVKHFSKSPIIYILPIIYIFIVYNVCVWFLRSFIIGHKQIWCNFGCSYNLCLFPKYKPKIHNEIFCYITGPLVLL